MTDIHDIEDKDVDINEEGTEEKNMAEVLEEIDYEEFTPNDEEIEGIQEGVEGLFEVSRDYLSRLDSEVDEVSELNERETNALKGFLINAMIKTELSTVVEVLVPEDRQEEILKEVMGTVNKTSKEEILKEAIKEGELDLDSEDIPDELAEVLGE